MLQRIKEYIDYKGLTIASFERSIGMSNASFGKSLKSNGSIGSDKIEKILSIYTDINTEWLITGRGSMIKNNYSLAVNDEQGEYKIKNKKEGPSDLIQEKEKRIQDLLHQINEKDIQIKDLLSILKQK